MGDIDVDALRKVAEAATAESWMSDWWANDAPDWAASTFGVAEIGDHFTAFDPPTVAQVVPIRGQQRAALERAKKAEATVARVRLVAEDHAATIAGMDLADALEDSL